MAYMAIKTKYLGPTNYRGSRIKATAMDTWYSEERPESVTVPYDYSALITEETHRQAAMTLLPRICKDADNMELIAGSTTDGYVFVYRRKAVEV
jgi:hypothetical protein